MILFVNENIFSALLIKLNENNLRQNYFIIIFHLNLCWKFFNQCFHILTEKNTEKLTKPIQNK